MPDRERFDEASRREPERLERPEVIAPGGKWDRGAPPGGLGYSAARRGEGPGPDTSSNRSLYILAAIGLGFLVYAIADGTIGLTSVVGYGVIVPAIILHEISHGAVALAFGDPTAKNAGRLTLNPIKHVDPFGTVVLPALLILTTGSAFGYAKPVPVNPRRMRSPRNHGLLVSLAGPGTNIVLAGLAAVGVALAFAPLVELQIRTDAFGEPPLWAVAVYLFGLFNVVLAVFNLLPIPPLDGSALIERVLPARWWPQYLRFRQYSMGLLLILVLVVPGDPLGKVFAPAIDGFNAIVFGSDLPALPADVLVGEAAA